MRTVLATLVLAAACGGGESTPDAEVVNCATETRDDTFVVGLEKAGDAGMLDYKLISADPAPPARNDNTWVIQINAMSGGVVGAPVTGATVGVTPFMPDHQHGAGKSVVITPLANPGQYQLAPINMWMPGLWETTIDATSASGNDTVVFRFCIPS